MRSYKIDSNNRLLLSKDMKIIELIDADYELLSILLRLDIQLPFGDMSIEQMCHRYNLSPELFLMICQIYASSDFEPSTDQLSGDDLHSILHYLRASHRYYLESVLPSIERGVESVLQDCDERQGAILRKFYGDYADEVRAHLNYEETQIFPYVESLLGNRLSEPRMAESMSHHTDICDKVDDIKSIIIKYLPESCPTRKRCDLLFDLYRLRDDLAKHTLIEIKILTPLAIAQEQKLTI